MYNWVFCENLISNIAQGISNFQGKDKPHCAEQEYLDIDNSVLVVGYWEKKERISNIEQGISNFQGKDKPHCAEHKYLDIDNINTKGV